MEINLNLSQLFFEAFGRDTPAFNPDFNLVFGDSPANRNENGTAAGTSFYGKDDMGREVYLPITLSYPDAGSNTPSFKDWVLNYAVVSIDSNKLLIRTPMTERRGEVVELVNQESYLINIKGFLINNISNNIPEADIMLLKKVYEINEPLVLRCALTDIFLGNDKVVIMSLNFPEVRGVKNVRPFEMKLMSDAIFNLIELQ